MIFSILFPDSINFHYFMDTTERRVWGERRHKDRVTLQIILVFILTRPQNIYTRPCHCIWKIFTRALCKIIYIYTLQQDKCKCKKFGRVSVNDLHIHEIYMQYITGIDPCMHIIWCISLLGMYLVWWEKNCCFSFN